MMLVGNCEVLKLNLGKGNVLKLLQLIRRHPKPYLQKD